MCLLKDLKSSGCWTKMMFCLEEVRKIERLKSHFFIMISCGNDLLCHHFFTILLWELALVHIAIGNVKMWDLAETCKADYVSIISYKAKSKIATWIYFTILAITWRMFLGACQYWKQTCLKCCEGGNLDGCTWKVCVGKGQADFTRK
jgi:hypothetical protein